MLRFLALLTVTVSTPALAAEVAVFPVNAVNLDEGSGAAIGELIAREYGDVSKQEVLSPSRTGQADNMSEAAQSLGVTEYIEITAVGLGGSNAIVVERKGKSAVVGNADTKILIQATRRQANGQVIYKAEMTARSLNDIEDVAERLALSLYHQKPVAETRTVNNVTRDEAAAKNRTFTEKVWGLRTQFLVPLAKGQKFEPAVGLTFDWRLEAPTYFLEFAVGFAIPPDSFDDAYGYGLLQGEVGGSYYLTEDTIAPYVGAGVQPRIVMADHYRSGINIAPYLQGGLMFFRDSSSRLYVDLRASQNVLPLKRQRFSSNTYYPTELSVQIGVGW